MGEDCELEGGLNFIGSLFENRTWRVEKERERVNKYLNRDLEEVAEKTLNADFRRC